MNEMALLSLVAMLGWLLLMIASYRSHRVKAGSTIRMALIWIGIFVSATFVASLMTG
jgi:hypothetical protein